MNTGIRRSLDIRTLAAVSDVRVHVSDVVGESTMMDKNTRIILPGVKGNGKDVLQNPTRGVEVDRDGNITLLSINFPTSTIERVDNDPDPITNQMAVEWLSGAVA